MAKLGSTGRTPANCRNTTLIKEGIAVILFSIKTDGMFKDTKAFFSFSVKDQAEAKKFYGETLGIDVKEQKEGLGLQISGGGQAFLYEKPNHEPARFTVLNFPVTKIEEAVSQLKEKGIEFLKYDTDDLKTDDQGIMRGNGPTIAWFTDPSGNILSVIETV